MIRQRPVAGDIASPRTYLATAAALILLTVVTVRLAAVDLGGWNVIVAIGIAAIKASLVALFFMHLYHDRKIYAVVFLVSITLLAVFLILTLFDTLSRGTLNPEEAHSIGASVTPSPRHRQGISQPKNRQSRHTKAEGRSTALRYISPGPIADGRQKPGDDGSCDAAKHGKNGLTRGAIRLY